METDDYNELTKDTGFSSRHISHIMKQCTGLTLKETITKLKMERAVHLLSETTLTVSEVADALGYSDIYTFSKLFKRYYGYSPSKIRVPEVKGAAPSASI
jgi:AraC-like DNA-binding protein